MIMILLQPSVEVDTLSYVLDMNIKLDTQETLNLIRTIFFCPENGVCF